MDTCNSISLYKLNLSYEARIRIILWAMVLLLQNLKMLQEQSGGQPSSKLNQLFSTRPGLDLRIKCMEDRATSESVFSVESIVD